MVLLAILEVCHISKELMSLLKMSRDYFGSCFQQWRSQDFGLGGAQPPKIFETILEI
jgi:hypothetical protein